MTASRRKKRTEGALPGTSMITCDDIIEETRSNEGQTEEVNKKKNHPDAYKNILSSP